MRQLAIAGVGLHYGLELVLQDDIDAGRLEVVRENHAPPTPGLFLYFPYFPTRAQVSPALKAFVDVARSVLGPVR
ncbi:MAG TPA: hypothetical protein VGF99_00485 [Myxococcota bacterium]